MRIHGIFRYSELDAAGESAAAARRMEARAREPASDEMFHCLVVPLLLAQPRRILELGCGTAALSRRIAKWLPEAEVTASDKSEGMLAAARLLSSPEGLPNLRFEAWDAIDESSDRFGAEGFDLVVSSVLVPYLDDAQVEGLIQRLAHRLRPGGVLAFIEQDLNSDSVNFPDFDLLRRVFNKDGRQLKRTLALGVRPLLQAAGLQPLPRSSFLWTDDRLGPYTRELLTQIAADARKGGRISEEEERRFLATLERLRQDGHFYYGLVYHLIAGRSSA
jgi:SAM-dependent methyltransferase